MAAYYNEFDKDAAQWLRNLIAAGLIAPGDVDERSIEDVSPDDLRGYTQHHFFAGIGVWSYALRQAGWPDDRPVWTGSCPCQPFSSAGAQAGFDDERHLWPAFYHLIQEFRPPVVFGEQVASKAAEPWIDLVQADLEAMEYAFGSIPFPSAGVGAPHIRDRNYWVGYSDDAGLEGHGRGHQTKGRHGERALRPATPAGESGGLADAHGKRLDGINTSIRTGQVGDVEAERCGEARNNRSELVGGVCRVPERSVGLAHAPSAGRQRGWAGQKGDGRDTARIESERLCEVGREPPAGPTNGFWGAVDWLLCRDGKWRPVEPGTFPLVDGAPARVVRLRAYGNAINAEAATQFIEAYLDAQDELLGRGLDLI